LMGVLMGCALFLFIYSKVCDFTHKDKKAGISMDLRHFRVESVWPRMVVSF